MRKVEVELLVPRTGVGEIGAIVEYDEELAARHVEWGLAKYVEPSNEDEPAKSPKKTAGKRKGKEEPPTQDPDGSPGE